MRRRVFWFHLNKPSTKQFGTPIFSVHWAGTCYRVGAVVADVPTWTATNKRQPIAVVKGRAKSMELRHSSRTGVITAYLE